MRFLRYVCPLAGALVLVVLAVGRAHRVGQRCADAGALLAPEGATASNPLTMQQTDAYLALLRGVSPNCAVSGLRTIIEATGTTGTTAIKTGSPAGGQHNVPKAVSGVDRLREYFTDQGLGTTEWVLLAVALGLVLRTIVALVVSRRPGSVDLGSVVDAAALPADDSAPAADRADSAVAAQLHQRLAARNLFGAPVVPGAGLAAAVATTLKDTSLPNTDWVASLIGSLSALWPKSGTTIDAVMRKGEIGPYDEGCTVTLKGAASGRVLTVFTAWEESPLLAADAAASFAVSYISDLPPIRRRTPVWARFGLANRKALVEYVQGEDWMSAKPTGPRLRLGAVGDEDSVAEVEIRILEALRHYETALKLAPGNLTIAMRVGGVLELLAAQAKGTPFEVTYRIRALKTYKRVADLWPETLDARYRLAITLDAFAQDDPFSPDLAAANLGYTTRRACSSEATRLLVEIHDRLTARAVARRWLKTFVSPTQRQAGTRRGHGRLMNPLRRRRLKATYKMSQLSVEYWAVDTKPAEIRRIESTVERLLCRSHPAGYSLISRSSVNWQVRYNAACFYARRGGDDDLRLANKLLEKVLRDPRHEISGTWLREDPDLANLRARSFGVNVLTQ